MCRKRPFAIHRRKRLQAGAAFGRGAVVGDHARRAPVPGQHDFGCRGAARRQFGREPDPATVRRHARLDAGGAGGGGEPALNLQRAQPDHPIRWCSMFGYRLARGRGLRLTGRRYARRAAFRRQRSGSAWRSRPQHGYRAGRAGRCVAWGGCGSATPAATRCSRHATGGGSPSGRNRRIGRAG